MSNALPNPAERAADAALDRVYACIKECKSFRLEAGAGAGKTHSLIMALRYLVRDQGTALLRRHQMVACITYTNVAKNEIESRTDRHPAIHCDTIHAFCWSMIKDFQSQLRKELPQIGSWPDKLQEAGGVGTRTIEYVLGYGKVYPESISLYHSDVLALFVTLMKYDKFRALLASRYPILFIDEYQDTDIGIAEALSTHYFGKEGAPIIGLFGDHWQKIYRGVCGKIDHPALVVIGKEANFRSVKIVVDALNRMRPELPQNVKDPDARGFVAVFHSNGWVGDRRTEAHWKGDLPEEVAHDCLNTLKETLTSQGWEFSPEKTKILMLTHNVLAKEQGYFNLASVFRYNDAIIEKTDPHIAFFIDRLEPVCIAYENKHFGQMFAALGGITPAIRSNTDKLNWVTDMEALLTIRGNGTIGAVVDHLRRTQHPPISDVVERKERELEQLGPAPHFEEESPFETLYKLRNVSYKEVVGLARFHDGLTTYSTNHGVKGAEFENVLVVVGRGWNLYNFNQMLELAGSPNSIPSSKWDAFERARNLFYVACSRPQKRLALLFTQELSDKALATLNIWFGEGAIRSFCIP